MRFVLLALLVACGGRPPPVANTKASPAVPAGFESDLAVFRAAHGQPWSPEQEPAMQACQRIFAGIPLVGQSEGDVQALLGPPDTVAPGRLDYMRHNGEVGCSRTLTIEDGHVAAVRVNMTQ